jgi:hypothetical protein
MKGEGDEGRGWKREGGRGREKERKGEGEEGRWRGREMERKGKKEGRKGVYLMPPKFHANFRTFNHKLLQK